MQANDQSNDPQPSEPSGTVLNQDRIANLVSEITDIRDRKKSGDPSAEELDRRLIELTEELSGLVALASTDEPPANAEPATSIQPQSLDQPSPIEQPDPTPQPASTFHEVRKPSDTVSDLPARESACTVQMDRSELPSLANRLSESPAPFSQQVGNQDLALIDARQEAEADSDTTDSKIAATALTDTEESNAEALTEPEQPSPPATESVADLLERLKADGQWGGIPDEDESYSPVEPVEPVAAAPEPEPAPTTNGDSESDVEDYMSQLLSRMRGGAAPTPAAPVQPKQPVVKPEAKTPSVDPASIIEPLKPEEFKPSRKAKPIESLSAMRELANTTARSAVHSSEIQRLRALAFVQFGIAVASLVMSAYYLMWCTSMGTTSYIIGGLCIGITIFLGIRCYDTMFKQIPFNEDKSRGGQKGESQDKSKNKLLAGAKSKRGQLVAKGENA